MLAYWHTTTRAYLQGQRGAAQGSGGVPAEAETESPLTQLARRREEAILYGPAGPKVQRGPAEAE